MVSAAHGGLQGVGSVEGDDLAVVDDGDPIGVLRLVHVVGGEEDGDPSSFGAGAWTSSQMRARVWGSRPTVGSSRNRTLGVWSMPSGDLEPAGHAARVGRHEVPSPVGEGDQIQHPANASVDLVVGDAVEDGMEPQVLFGGQLIVESLLLKDEPDVPAYRPWPLMRRRSRPPWPDPRSDGPGCRAS
jgi:hypothetical protein